MKSPKLVLALIASALFFFLPLRSANATTSSTFTFTRDSPNVVWTGGTNDGCAVGVKYGATATLTFADSYGGSPVTVQTAHNASCNAVPVTVNGTAVASFPSGACSCGSSGVETPMTITAAYNNNSNTKTIVFNGGSGYYFWTLTLAANTTDPMFKIVETLLPGVSTPTPAGFTNQVLPNFSWASLAATSYELQISSDPFFNSPMVADATGITAISYQLTVANQLVVGASYYTRLKATGGPSSGMWSYITDFTVATTVPSTPQLVSPPNPSNVSSQTPTFNWNPVTLGTE